LRKGAIKIKQHYNEDYKMAEEEKSNSNKVLIVMTIIAVVLVLVLKSDETKHLEMAGTGTTLEGNAAALQAVKRYDNNFYE